MSVQTETIVRTHQSVQTTPWAPHNVWICMDRCSQFSTLIAHTDAHILKNKGCIPRLLLRRFLQNLLVYLANFRAYALLLAIMFFYYIWWASTTKSIHVQEGLLHERDVMWGIVMDRYKRWWSRRIAHADSDVEELDFLRHSDSVI